MKAFGLLFGFGFKFDFGQLTDAVNEVGDGAAKTTANLAFGDAGIFDHVMEQRGHKAFVIHAHVGQNVGDSKGVRNIGITTLAHLAAVTLFRVFVGALDPSYFFRVEVRGEFIR